MSEDIGHKLTDEELLRLERRILKIYRAAEVEAADIVNDYFAAFRIRDEKMRRAVAAGELTEEEYKQWRLAQIGRGERWEAMRDKLAERMTAANEVAAAYMNDTTPGIYSLNRNYTAYTINQYHPDADFTLFDERTVRRLIVEQPDLMPSYPETRAVERGIDLAFGKRQITAQVTSSILLGESIPHMADKLQKHIVDMNRTSAIRAARTATTAAECAGRQDTYMAAEKMGISLKKEWMATLDARTRAEHGEADGQVVAVDAPFTVGGEKLMAPGDRAHGASGWNIYNCRCTTVAVIPGIKSSRQTYSEWLEEKRSELGDDGLSVEFNKVKYEAADKKQFTNYQKVLKGHAPKTLEDFQRIKYNDPKKWEQLKYEYRTVNRYEVIGNVSVDKILELDEVAWRDKQTGVVWNSLSGKNRQKVKNIRKSGNAGVMEYRGKVHYAHSQLDSAQVDGQTVYIGKEPLIGLQQQRKYTVLDLGDNIPRQNDTEAKFFEYLAAVLKPDSKTTVTILSEKNMCESCREVMKQFSADFPGVTVNIVCGKKNYNGSEEGTRTWKHRK